jgi:hypothetical protein
MGIPATGQGGREGSAKPERDDSLNQQVFEVPMKPNPIPRPSSKMRGTLPRRYLLFGLRPQPVLGFGGLFSPSVFNWDPEGPSVSDSE